MPAEDILDRVSIASPCSASWADMKGDDRVRFCGLCEKRVYNLSAMPRAEAIALVAGSEGRLCARFYRRKDGTILTADCPVGLATRARRRLFRMASMAVLGLAATLSGASRASARLGEAAVSAPQSSVWAWFDWALQKLGLSGPPPAPRGMDILGGIGMVPPSGPATPPAGTP